MPSASSNPSGAEQYAIQLPSDAFAKVAPYSHLAAHLLPQRSTNTTERPPRKPLRPCGRTASEFREPSCTTNSLSHCVGSAVTRLGDSTSVVCGIQAEILTLPPAPYDSSSVDAGEGRTDHDRNKSDRQKLATLNLLVPNVDLATGADPDHLPTTGSGAPSAEAQVLSSRILSLLLRSNVISLDSLRISGHHSARRRSSQDDMDVDSSTSSPSSPPDDDDDIPKEPETYWVLYISLLPLSISGKTSLFDALWAATVAALRTTRLPRAYWDGDAESVLCSRKEEEYRTLHVRGCPFAASFGVFVAPLGRVRTLEGGDEPPQDTEKEGEVGEGMRTLSDGRLAWVLADPEAGEDELCSETVTVVLDDRGETNWKFGILAVEKKGGSVLGWEDMEGVFDMAEERWREWRPAVLPWD
ncbi:MAG: hypothetical protein M1828_006211 [Chrysothrix sp. TS-e1954]|nr:MAG: hypothetical protein M1828_006211 [Chrysothrix sp. TS-e1954]